MAKPQHRPLHLNGELPMLQQGRALMSAEEDTNLLTIQHDAEL